ncbi:sulfatase [Galbibacter sp. BG1]|uniref:sulfatase family protein n=1 Tax=Galbibacter sp. BG1 TaxID=1170699 RepID=UPI0015C0191C|nr:sulfatase [Galbibacter sp. BG1]QLE02193.1 sulfatase [Galbibacter sp. BG1]
MKKIIGICLFLSFIKSYTQEEIVNREVVERPNVIFVLADDWSFPHASIYGDKVVKTPNFDRIAKNGLLFTNAYSAAPSCTPARAAILTGRYPHALNEGANLWGTLPNSFPNYTRILESAGYIVAFQEKGWAPGNYEVGGYKRNPSGTEIENFEHFIENTPKDKPFCLWYGTRDPHRPYTQGFGVEAGLSMDKVELPSFWPQDSVIKSDVLDYYYEVQRLDYDLGRILFRLERNNLLDNTIIIVTSDNGMPFPRAKANCYDLGTKVPLAISWGKHLAKGKTIDSYINLIDIAPTILEAAKLEVPKEMQGHSFYGLLSNTHYEPQEKVFLERERHAFAREENYAYPIRAVRDNHFLFIHNLRSHRWPAGSPEWNYSDIDNGPSKSVMVSKKDENGVYSRFYALSTEKRPEYELYSLKDDPDQINNLAYDSAYKKIVRTYKEELEKWRLKTADTIIKSEVTKFDLYEYYGKKK